jgi:catechol 2,3-dioxygenase-like lactoylglutathione lyase family enzyme
VSELTPEFCVSDIAVSQHFYLDTLGFTLLYDRPEEDFVCIAYEGCKLMLDQLGTGRDFITGPLERPYGRGMNLEFSVSDVAPLLGRLEAAGVPLFLSLETKAYRVGDKTVLQRQFCVQDPDGYLLRFADSR